MREQDDFSDVHVRVLSETYTEEGQKMVMNVGAPSNDRIEEYANHLRDDHGLTVTEYDPSKLRGSDKIFAAFDSGKWNATWEPTGAKIKPGYPKPPVHPELN